MQKVHLQVVTKLFILYIICFEKESSQRRKTGNSAQPSPTPLWYYVSLGPAR